MFKVTVKSKLSADVKARLQKTVNDKFVDDMNREVMGEVDRLMDAGVSPVRSVEGGRRFKGYKNPAKYPGDKKAKRPTNLYLTGLMRAFYLVVKISGVRVSFGIPSNAPKDVKDRAEANNVGTVNSKGEVAIAARRFIPLAGETYTVSIIRKMKSLYAARIKELISKK